MKGGVYRMLTEHRGSKEDSAGGFPRAGGILTCQKTGRQCMVPFAFQAGAYPVIQGQPFPEPVT